MGLPHRPEMLEISQLLYLYANVGFLPHTVVIIG